MTRILAVIATICALALGAAACSSSGTHVQSPGPTTPSSSGDGSSANSSSPTAIPSWTPPPYGQAQPAVDVLEKVLSAYAQAIKDPPTYSAASFDKYLAGQAKDAFASALTEAKKQGVAYRGSPAVPRIVLVSDRTRSSVREVVLANCPLISSRDPFRAYYTATGKPVPVPTPKVPQPYLQTAKIFLVNGQWRITSFITDDAKTCTR